MFSELLPWPEPPHQALPNPLPAPFLPCHLNCIMCLMFLVFHRFLHCFRVLRKRLAYLRGMRSGIHQCPSTIYRPRPKEIPLISFETWSQHSIYQLLVVRRTGTNNVETRTASFCIFISPYNNPTLQLSLHVPFVQYYSPFVPLCLLNCILLFNAHEA